MTTLTVEIDKDKDLSALKEFIGQLGLNYQVDNDGDTLYTDEVKNMLDKRYNDYLAGSAETISADDSQKRVKELLTKGK